MNSQSQPRRGKNLWCRGREGGREELGANGRRARRVCGWASKDKQRVGGVGGQLKCTRWGASTLRAALSHLIVPRTRNEMPAKLKKCLSQFQAALPILSCLAPAADQKSGAREKHDWLQPGDYADDDAGANHACPKRALHTTRPPLLTPPTSRARAAAPHNPPIF